MAFSTAAVLYSFFRQVESTNEDLGLWKCVAMRTDEWRRDFTRYFHGDAESTQHKVFHQQQTSSQNSHA
jgi:hypothetical protein